MIPNSGGASTPCFSPDSRWVAFVARGALHRAYVAGGTPTVICEAGSDCRGLSWSVRGEIVFAPTPASGLLAVPADGGRPLEITRLDFRSGERTHRWPHVLPDGNQVLFTVARAGSASFDEADIWLLHRDTGERRVVQGFGTAAQFASSGHLMYVRGGSLMTVPFAPDQGQVSGTPIPAVTGLMPLPTGAGLFAHSDSGLIMYLTGDAQDTGQCLAWLTGDGSLDSLDVPGAAFDEPRLSSDGLRIAVGVRSGKSDIWIRDCQHGGLRRFTFTGDNFAPIWTRDNRSIIFSSNRHGPCSLYLKGLDDAEPVRLVSSDFDLVPGSLSRDGRVVLFTEYHPETGADLYSYRMGTDEGPRPILRTRANEFCPTLAPDGRGLAFVSDQSGRHEVYLMPFPEGEPVTPVTTSGGSEPVWHPDGRRLYYRVGSAICAMDVDGVTPVRGSEAVVGDGPFRAGSPTGIANYDVSQDGRLLVVKQTTAHARPTELSVIVNWSPADLR